MKKIDLIKENNLRVIRESKGFSRRVMAMACGSDISQIRKYERGERMPCYHVLRSFSRFLGASIEEIYPSFVELDKVQDKIKDLVINMGRIRPD